MARLKHSYYFLRECTFYHSPFIDNLKSKIDKNYAKALRNFETLQLFIFKSTADTFVYGYLLIIFYIWKFIF